MGAYIRGPDDGHPGIPGPVEGGERAVDVAAGGSAFGSFTCVLSGGDASRLNGERPGGGSPPDTALPSIREGSES